jgi:spermidine synthase
MNQGPLVPDRADLVDGTLRRWPLLEAAAEREHVFRSFMAIFLLAGMPALIYQVAWQRLLTLYFGVDIYSTAITVSAFMAGLGIGSLVGGRIADRTTRPAVWYGRAELLLAVVGALSPLVFPAVGRLVSGSALPIVAIVDFLLLVIPTSLMGMTLPLMSRIVVVADDAIGARVSYLYGLNTLGAALGALVSSYVLIGWLGLDGTIYLAAFLNGALALAVWRLATSQRPSRPRAPEPLNVAGVSTPAGRGSVRTLAVLAFGSGLVALGYEMVWYRVLSIILHATVYVFGTVLCVFLIGVALGSLRAARTIDTPGALRRFGRAQLMMAGYVLAFFTVLGHLTGSPGVRHALAASFFTSFHPSPEIAAGNISLYSLYSLLDVPLWTAAMVGVPTFLMGYGLPNLFRAATRSVAVLGGSIGQLYAANIAGSTLGGLLVGLVALHYLGSERTLLVLTTLGTLLGSIAVCHARPPALRDGLLLAAIVALATLFPVREQLIRAIHLAEVPGVTFVAREDRSGVVALRNQHRVIAFSEERSILGQSRLYIDGVAHGRGDDSTDATDWPVEMAMTALPQPARVLAIGLGDGVMCETALKSTHLRELVIVELNGALADVLRTTRRGATVLSSPKVRYVVDDGRRWLLANPHEKFDLIMMFPLHAAHALSGNLFSTEFLETVRDHLTAGGTLLVTTVDQYATARTIATVYDHVIRVNQSTYLARPSPFRFDAGRLPFPAGELASRIEADRATILSRTTAARVNRDLRPNSEYYLTYRFAHVLQTTVAGHSYFAQDRAPFAALAVARTGQSPIPSGEPAAGGD